MFSHYLSLSLSLSLFVEDNLLAVIFDLSAKGFDECEVFRFFFRMRQMRLFQLSQLSVELLSPKQNSYFLRGKILHLFKSKQEDVNV